VAGSLERNGDHLNEVLEREGVTGLQIFISREFSHSKSVFHQIKTVTRCFRLAAILGTSLTSLEGLEIMTGVWKSVRIETSLES
jgi:hypothetical protein